MKRTISLILGIVTVIGLFSGCQPSQDVYTPTGDALILEDGNPVHVPEETPEEQDLTLAYYPEIPLNPLTCTDYTNRTILPLLYQGLFVTDRNYNVAPILCKQYSVSQDMRTYTFYLENATFSDGSSLTPADVVATYATAKESTYYAGRFLHITDVFPSEDGGVTITLDTPMENLPILLDIPIVKAGEGSAEKPLGTGPYFLDTSSGNALLRRRLNWLCSAEISITATAIRLIAAESNAQIRDEFEFSDLNLVCANPGSDRYTDYRCDYELWDCENGVFLYLSCNLTGSIFSVPEVRSALTFAIDRETIAADNYRGFGRPASLPASPLSPYYSQVQAEKYDYDGGLAFNQAVADAGLVGSNLIFLVNSDDTMRVRIARYIAKALTSAGFVVIMKECNGKDYQYALQVREYDLLLGQTKLSPNMDLSAFFASNGALNYGSIADVSLYALCVESLANYGNYYTLHQQVMDDGRLCPILFSSYAVYATRGLLENLAPSRDNVFYYHLDKNMEEILVKAE